MPKKAETKKQKTIVESKELEKKGTNFFDYLRFGESYTSLILGIIVVIVTTALLLSFVHNKNAGNVNTPISEQTQNTVQISQQTQELAKQAPNSIDTAVSIGPTATPQPTAVPTQAPRPTAVPKPTAKPTIAPRPTARPTIALKPTAKPVVKPTTKPAQKITPKPTQKPKATPTVVKQVAKVNKTPKQQVKTTKNNNVWVVQKGESLWLIAEKKYTSGYNWVDIARVNNLSNPSDIHAGDRLVLPNVPTKTPTLASAPKNVIKNSSTVATQKPASGVMTAITGSSYTVTRGDNLWNIAVRAYGDGYKWPQIAQANHLTDPRMIFSGNVLTIPR